jgi:hypothetical protein
MISRLNVSLSSFSMRELPELNSLLCSDQVCPWIQWTGLAVCLPFTIRDMKTSLYSGIKSDRKSVRLQDYLHKEKCTIKILGNLTFWSFMVTSLLAPPHKHIVIFGFFNYLQKLQYTVCFTRLQDEVICVIQNSTYFKQLFTT